MLSIWIILIGFTCLVASQTVTYCPTNQKCSAYCYLRQNKFYTSNAYPQTVTLTPVFVNVPQGASLSAEWTIFDGSGTRHPKVLQSPSSTYSLSVTSSNPYYAMIALRDTTYNFMYCTLTNQLMLVSTNYAITALPVFNYPLNSGSYQPCTSSGICPNPPTYYANMLPSATAYWLDTGQNICVDQGGIMIYRTKTLFHFGTGFWAQFRVCPDANDYKSYNMSKQFYFFADQPSAQVMSGSGLPLPCYNMWAIFTVPDSSTVKYFYTTDPVVATDTSNYNYYWNTVTSSASYFQLWFVNGASNVNNTNVQITVQSVQPYNSDPCTDTTLASCKTGGTAC